MIDPRSETASVEAAAALLAHLEDATTMVTYLDLSMAETMPLFEAIERVREDVADLFGVDVFIYAQKRDETVEQWQARLDEDGGES